LIGFYDLVLKSQLILSFRHPPCFISISYGTLKKKLTKNPFGKYDVILSSQPKDNCLFPMNRQLFWPEHPLIFSIEGAFQMKFIRWHFINVFVMLYYMFSSIHLWPRLLNIFCISSIISIVFVSFSIPLLSLFCYLFTFMMMLFTTRWYGTFGCYITWLPTWGFSWLGAYLPQKKVLNY